ncbi:hypothetical protein DS67_05555 [Mesotoga sp. SC_4PWA21]|nr:hypothetical protein DS67_05555 [Mesotoga sp. SC_4PWA21]
MSRLLSLTRWAFLWALVFGFPAVVAALTGAGQVYRWNQLEIDGPSARHSHAMAYDVQRDVVVLFGGNDGAPLNDTWEWDGREWKHLSTSGPCPRSRHAVAYDSDRGVAVVFGGIPREPADTWEWNGNSWKIVDVSGPEGRSRAGMVYDASKKLIVLFGGRLSNGECSVTRGLGTATNGFKSPVTTSLLAQDTRWYMTV